MLLFSLSYLKATSKPKQGQETKKEGEATDTRINLCAQLKDGSAGRLDGPSIGWWVSWGVGRLVGQLGGRSVVRSVGGSIGRQQDCRL